MLFHQRNQLLDCHRAGQRCLDAHCLPALGFPLALPLPVCLQLRNQYALGRQLVLLHGFPAVHCDLMVILHGLWDFFPWQRLYLAAASARHISPKFSFQLGGTELLPRLNADN